MAKPNVAQRGVEGEGPVDIGYPKGDVEGMQASVQSVFQSRSEIAASRPERRAAT
jgi:hypothetical protein